jgi:hypothetical protein
MLTRTSGVGANAGGSNAGISAAGPMYTHTNPPASWDGYVLCLTLLLSVLCAGSDGTSTTLPSTSIFQPWYRQRSPHSSLRPRTRDARRCGTVLVEDAEPSPGVAEHHQVLAEEARAHRRAVGFGHLFREAGRHPMAAHEAPHRRVAFDAAEQVVFLGVQHGKSAGG